jgi:MarR family transcriptional regulator for hemolysin
MRTENHNEGHAAHGEREDNLVRTMARTAQAMRRHLEKTIADVPGGMSAWWVLRHLHQAGPQAQADMARSVGVAGSTLTRRLEQMEADGLITRTADPDDGRRIIVALSEAGESTRGGQRERADAEVARLVANVAPEDLEAFGRMVEKIRENLLELGTDPDGRGGGLRARSGFGGGGGGGRGRGGGGGRHSGGGPGGRRGPHEDAVPA